MTQPVKDGGSEVSLEKAAGRNFPQPFGPWSYISTERVSPVAANLPRESSIWGRIADALATLHEAAEMARRNGDSLILVRANRGIAA